MLYLRCAYAIFPSYRHWTAIPLVDKFAGSSLRYFSTARNSSRRECKHPSTLSGPWCDLRLSYWQADMGPQMHLMDWVEGNAEVP